MKRFGLFAYSVCFVAACSSSPSDGPGASGAEDAGMDSMAPDAGASTNSDDAGDASIQPDTVLDATSTTDSHKFTDSDGGQLSSRGSGGLACSSNGTVIANGVTYSYCVATVGGVEMKIVAPNEGSTTPLRLALYLHGDGAGPYASGLDIRKHAPWTTAHGVLYVAARAPNACSWWLKPSYTTCDGTTPIPDDAVDRSGENAQAADAVIQAVRAGWDIADSPVLFGGASGGSIFLTASFLPLYGDKFPGGYALSCGGGPPWDGKLAWDSSKPGMIGATKLFFTYGDADFVAPEVEQAISFYQHLGFPTDLKVIPETVEAGTSHCGNIGGAYSYDQLGRVPEVWSSYLGE